jgi:hypothetical protein
MRQTATDVKKCDNSSYDLVGQTTRTRITISDKYALSGNDNLVEKNKKET